GLGFCFAKQGGFGMNKEEYLTRLQYCISQLPPVEAQNTMQYYREYFDDAGEENFASVMAELGTPEQLAAKICSSYGINYQQPVNENNTSKAVIIAIIAVLTCPIWFTAGIVILSLVFSLFMVILSLIFSAGVVGICLIFAGLLVFAAGFPTLFTHVPTGTMLIGAGLVLCAVGILFSLLLIWMILGTKDLISFIIKKIKKFIEKRKTRKAYSGKAGIQ
ncbi:MAG: DUF1700 domain-containing protein, partial [Lachnospira sp.]|nr:DUF1700 domain-containing protein [Lachnospira sp.]